MHYSSLPIKRRGFTFIEVLLVTAIISLMTLPLLMNYANVANTRGLKTSLGVVEDVMKTAHIFGREARDKKGWGVISVSTKEVALVQGTPENYKVMQQVPLERNVTVETPFSIWFGLGTGETGVQQDIYLINQLDRRGKLTIYTTGAIDTTVL